MKSINDYWDALNRLKKNTPKRVPIGSKINKDTVSLEAGRKRGSIKKSRNGFSDLISEIEKASNACTRPKSDLALTIKRIKSEKHDYREKYHQSLNREIMLLNRIAELEKKLNKLSNVVSIRK